jgi:hypothetical protein
LDFVRIRSLTISMNDTVTILLTHQTPTQVQRMVEWWGQQVSSTDYLIAYGGAEEEFSKIQTSKKVFVSDPRLRTQDHVRERQSYSGVFRTASAKLRRLGFQYVWFVEYDHIPIVSNVVALLKERMGNASADVICYNLGRIDRTISPHFLGHAKDPEFFDLWQRISVREEKGVVLSMFASGSLWKREAFEAIAATDESFPVYQEVYLPTLAHHLGFRLCDLGAQKDFIRAVPTRTLTFEFGKAHGALTVHPLKHFWDK